MAQLTDLEKVRRSRARRKLVHNLATLLLFAAIVVVVTALVRRRWFGLLTLLFELPTPLMRDWQEGRFYLMNPIEIAHETLILLEHIDSEGSIFRANHASNYVNLSGTLNQDREAMCARLRKALEGKIKFKSEQYRAR